MPTSLFALPSMLGIVLSIGVSLHLLSRRTGAASLYAALDGFAIAWWCFGQTLWVLLDEPGARRHIAQFQYIGITSTPVFWFLATQAYCGRIFWLRGWPQRLLWLVPAMTTVLAFTNDAHHLIWTQLDPVPGDPRVSVEYGAWFPVHAGYSYGLVILGTASVALRFAASPLYRPQLIAILLGPAAILFASVLHLTLRAFLPMDPTPSAFVLAYAALGWAILRHRLFDLLPLARDLTLDSLREGVIVLDETGRIVDSNPASGELLSWGGAKPLGETLASLLPEATNLVPGEAQEIRLRNDRRVEVQIRDVRSTGFSEGRVVVIRDVTEARLAEDKLLVAQDELRRLNEELDRIAHTDELTGLANRRRFLARLQEEWARARRHERQLSLVILDLDRFKQVNDTMGHPTGDRVLERVGRSMAALLRPEDMAARYGGEEFAVLLPETDLAGACETARRLQTTLRGLRHVNPSGESFEVTISAGAAALEPGDASSESLVCRADAALYFTKEHGRDGVSAASPQGFERLDS